MHMKNNLLKGLSLLLVLSMCIGLLPMTALADYQTGFDNFQTQNRYENEIFSDVNPSDWYYEAVKTVYERNLMIGKGANCFAANSDVTVAEALTLTARLHSIYSGENRSFTQGTLWYQAYVDYLAEKGLFEFSGMDLQSAATRAQVAELLSAALPDEGFAQQSMVADNAIPDVQSGAPYANAVYKLYRAGVLVGKDSQGVFDPDSNIKRSELAAIVARIAEPSLRKSIQLGDEDADADGVPDWLETYFGSSSAAQDSDEDGIDDYTELYLIRSDPTVADSALDTDGDGLTNYEEVVIYQTNPVRVDSDFDGLQDGEEINEYRSDPLQEDTDGDGILDGDELRLGLNLFAADDLSQIPQTLGEEAIDASLIASDVRMGVSGTADAVLDRSVALHESDAEALKRNQAVVGKGVELSIEEGRRAKLLLTFDGLNDNAALVIMRMDEAGNWNPVETRHTQSGLSTVATSSGVFCVMDLNILLPLLGVDTERYYKEVLSGQVGSDAATQGAVQSDLAGGSADKAPSGATEARILLGDFQSLSLSQTRAPRHGDSDLDGLSDYEELLPPQQKEVTALLKQQLISRGVPEVLVEAYFQTEDGVYVTYYPYRSNPALTDSDFDGRNDAEDAVSTGPDSNSFAGTLKTDQASSSVSFSMDYRWFFGDNTKYNEKLSKVSSLFAAAIYEGSELSIHDVSNRYTTDGKTIKAVLNYFGMPNAVTRTIAEADVHKSEVGIGHRTVSYQGVTKNIVAVVIRGTNGTIEEWSSNFEIGKLSRFHSVSDWVTPEHHEGFDVASVRLMRFVDAYMAEHQLNSANTVYWITGHSRGAAIANLIGAYYEDAGKTAFTYTFAAPNTTMKANASSYRSIFNIVNQDDFVPCLPMEGWNYTRYGRVASASIAAQYEKQWESLTGKFDYNPDTYGMERTVAALTNILSGDARVGCYKYTCRHHGDGSNDTITITNYGMSRNSRETAIAKIPQNALPYCAITRYDGSWFWGWDFDVCQTPAYFMQILAATMSGTIGYYRFVVELDVADRYESAKTEIIKSALSGIEHPHYTESYYVLAENLKAADFHN